MNADEFKEFLDAVNEELDCEYGADCDDLKVDEAELLKIANQPPHVAAWLLAEKHALRPKGSY